MAWHGSDCVTSYEVDRGRAHLTRGMSRRLPIDSRLVSGNFAACSVATSGQRPITVAQTRRVLLAKQLIHQTNLSMIEVALASGFGSVRRFNETFQRMYHRPPSELRRRATSGSPSAAITILLPYRPPYDWATMIRFFEVRAIAGLEVVTRESYSRVVEFGQCRWLDPCV